MSVTGPLRRLGGRVRCRDGLERGAAVPEFVLVMMVLIPLVIGIFQFGLFLHVRNTMAACAHEGARVAANYRTSVEEGVTWTRACIEAALNPTFAERITPDVQSAAGQAVVVINVTATMPAIGFFGGIADFTVSGHAVDEPDVL